MTDNFAADLFSQTRQSGKKRHVYTVSEITQDIKILLENAFTEVWVEGEISNANAHPSGHFYLSLKDKDAVLPAAIFAYRSKNIKFKLENGLKVICSGKLNVYPPLGKYTFLIDRLEPKGIGGLQLALEQLKKKLEGEGLFAAEHKRPIPYLPSGVGIVTSLSGAAIKDILKVLDRRFSGARIVISPAQVQGEGSGPDIVRAIKLINEFNDTLAVSERIEVMIVGRGGGSIEDLWAFNEEVVARAIYESKIPVISAVGHERDWTIADLVADLRAPTPSVAAELVIPKKEDLWVKLDSLRQGLLRAAEEAVLDFRQVIEDRAWRMQLGAENIFKLNLAVFTAAEKKLSMLNPAVLIGQNIRKIADLSRQIQVRAGHFIELRQTRLMSAAQRLSTLSPLNVLGRGYSIAFKMPGNIVVKDAAMVTKGDIIKTRLDKGEVLSQVTEVKKDGRDKI
ncbi:MAG: exodeoxyribonuclease VII large subunit [Candidatus Omnitrophota bacterium]|nr:exodeoxyribonuclease VII large subunit [Candidatus Omnitrophota bacterium]